MAESSTEVRVMPWFSPEYYAYLWTGLHQVFPGGVSLDARAFPARQSDPEWSPRSCFAFIVDDTVISVDANDHADVAPGILEWSDVHGRVNVRDADVTPNVLPIGPAFGIKAWDRVGSLRLAAAMARSPHPHGWGYRALAATLRRQHQRLTLDDYRPRADQVGDGVFYLGSFWSRHRDANHDRVLFLEAAHAVVPDRISGGLVGSQHQDLEPRLRAPAMSQRDYVERVRRSLVVFNHDAVHGCLGWKLGEYLALGKAILTTPIRNALPSPLVHGQHCHVVEPSLEAISAGIEQIVANEDYRRHLESGAASWHAAHMSPAAVVRRLLSASIKTP